MAFSPSSGSFNVGRDLTLVVLHPNAVGGRMDLRNLTDFKSRQTVQKVKVPLITGKTMTANLPMNWTGSFDIARGSPDGDTLIAAIEQGWFAAAGGIYNYGTMYAYVAEVGGGQTTFQFTDWIVEMTDAGNFRGDAEVKQSFSWEASYRNML